MDLHDFKYYEEKHLNIEDFEFGTFERVELLLFLVSYLDIAGKIDDYYLILGGRGLISRHSFNSGDYFVQNARILLKTINQKKVYMDELNKYETDETNISKVYKREGDKFVKIENMSDVIEEREKLYIKLLSLDIQFSLSEKKYALMDGKRYGIIIDDKPIELKFSKGIKPATLPKTSKKKYGNLKVSINDLIEEAKVADDKLSVKETAFRMRVMENNVFKIVDKGKLHRVEEIEISKVTNIVGQVGAGKSTFSDAVVKKLAKEKRKIVIIEPSVIKSLRKSEDLVKLGLKAVPIIGASNWKEHINKASDGKDFLRDYDSKILTNGCPLGGLVEELGVTIEYGKEPCKEIYRFFEKDKFKINQLNDSVKYQCPYYYICPKTKIQAEILSSDVIVTTSAGLTTMTIGISGVTLFQHVLENIDLIIIDEAESELQKLDKIFAPYISYDDYIKNNGNIPGEHYKKSSDDRISSNENDRREFIRLHQESDRAFTKIHTLLDKDRQGFSKSNLKKSFTGKMLIKECNDKKKLPSIICKELEQMIGLNRNRKYKGILQDLIDVKNENDLSESFDDYQWGIKEKLLKEQVNMIIFIGAVLYFEDLYRNISNLVSGNVVLPMSTKDILSQRFQFHQRYIPVSPNGNIFAFKYKDKENNAKSDLCVIKQFAMGRAMYLRFPWLKLDFQGNPMGPNVMLLSGSSFAPGSLANHIREPVNYIIESEKFKRDFISKTHFEYLDYGIYVSGSGEKRDERLRKLVSECRELILEKLESKDNNILMVVNSYNDTEVVKIALKDILKDTEYSDKIAYLVSDSDNDEGEGKIKQSKVGEFASKSLRVLIAPAILIERGHNIVDVSGNAAFDTLIFMTRPMARPDDYTSHVSKVNGYIMNKYSHKNYGVDTNVFSDMRKDSNIMYNSLGYSGDSIDDLDSKVKKDIVVTLFVTILQIFGRLCRIGNEENIKTNAPAVYFADSSFKANKKNGFDFLNELVDYLDEIINVDYAYSEVAKTLYEPFYNALKKGRHIYGKR